MFSSRSKRMISYQDRIHTTCGRAESQIPGYFPVRRFGSRFAMTEFPLRRLESQARKLLSKLIYPSLRELFSG